ncbi:MAG: hypothetical protein WCJ35_01490 [Planctomycetota bacterium]
MGTFTLFWIGSRNAPFCSRSVLHPPYVELAATAVGKVVINAACLLCTAYMAQADGTDGSYYAAYIVSAMETAVFLDFAKMAGIF